jgi:ATP-binding cassette subfamily D (ALD) long-chain fatty acid import protein
MAAQSKLHLPTQISTSFIKSLVSNLTSLYLKNRSRISRAIFLTLIVTLISRIHSAIGEQKAAAARALETRGKAASLKAPSVDQKKKKVELDREFYKNLWRLLRIVIPGWRSKEFRLLISHSVFLVVRTLISLYVAELDGRLVSSLVRGKGRDFLMDLVWWMVVAVPATFTNSMVCPLLQR